MLIRFDACRESVAAGDDFNAPHRFKANVEVGENSETAALEGVKALVEAHRYLPSVEGGSTWAVYSGDVPVAVVRLDRKQMPTITPTGLSVKVSSALELRFAYHQDADVAELLKHVTRHFG